MIAAVSVRFKKVITLKKRFRPSVDSLEGRLLLYSTLGKWAFPSRITYSVVPDGTSTVGQTSNLQSTLAGLSGWEDQLERAAAVWSASSGIDLVRVSDDGATIGSGGYQQGDPLHGDIRISGYPNGTGFGVALATTWAPPPASESSLASDIFINTSYAWKTNGTIYDLQSVMIHEFGHALGLGHSSFSTSVLYPDYNSTKQALTSDDISGIQYLYGARPADPLDSGAGNNTSATATSMTSWFDGNNYLGLARLDITNSTDVDWLSFTVPTVGDITFKMQSEKISSLTPAFEVYNYSGGILTLLSSTAATANKGGGSTITNTLRATSGQVFYVKTMAGTTGPHAIGTYHFFIQAGGATGIPNTTVVAQPEGSQPNPPPPIMPVKHVSPLIARREHRRDMLKLWRMMHRPRVHA